MKKHGNVNYGECKQNINKVQTRMELPETVSIAYRLKVYKHKMGVAGRQPMQSEFLPRVSNIKVQQ